MFCQLQFTLGRVRGGDLREGEHHDGKLLKKSPIFRSRELILYGQVARVVI